MSLTRTVMPRHQTREGRYFYRDRPAIPAQSIWRFIGEGRGLYSLRVSRLVASRIKKWVVARRHKGRVRVRVGSLHVLFKKSQNARMGKGIGAYFARRRFVFPGFIWVEGLGGATPRVLHLWRYLCVRWLGRVALVTLGFNPLSGMAWRGGRWAESRAAAVKRRSKDVEALAQSGLGRRRFYYKHWGSRLTRRRPQMFLRRRIRVLCRLMAGLRVALKRHRRLRWRRGV